MRYRFSFHAMMIKRGFHICPRCEGSGFWEDRNGRSHDCIKCETTGYLGNEAMTHFKRMPKCLTFTSV